MRRHVLVWMAAAHALACAAPPADDAAREPMRAGVYGQAPAAVGGVPSVVSLTPTGPAVVGPPTTLATVDQVGMAFSPTRLIVPVGSTIQFTNSDPLTHNVRLSMSGGRTPFFDRDTDPSEAVDFEAEDVGGIDVACTAHPGMIGFLYVTDAAHTVFAETDGSFELTDVQPGQYTLTVWSADADLRTQIPLEVGLEAVEVVFPPTG